MHGVNISCDNTRLLMDVNGSHITIKNAKTKEVLFSRKPEDDNWYDNPHRRIVNALWELDNALFDAAYPTPPSPSSQA